MFGKGTFKATSISACFECHSFSKSFVSASFSSADLRACWTSSRLVRIRSIARLAGFYRERIPPIDRFVNHVSVRAWRLCCACG